MAQNFIPDDQFVSDEDKYGSDLEQAKTFAEGAIKGALPFGAGTAIESSLFNNEKQQKLREENNPEVKLAGDVAGFGASAFVPVAGQARVLGAAGNAVTRALGLSGATSLAGKVGASAAKQASEMALLGLGDEVSKNILHDPDQTAETMLTNIGLSAIVGGALGGGGALIANPLKDAVKGSKLGILLKAIQDKATGVSGTTQISDLAQQAGMDFSPEMQAAMSGQHDIAQTLAESASKSGDQMRDSIKTAKQASVDSLLGAFGKSSEDLSSIQDLSHYEKGQGVKDALVSELKGITEPISAQFEPIKERFSSVPLTGATKNDIAEKLGQIALEGGHSLRSDSPALKEINSLIKDLPNLKTLEDVRKVQSSLREDLNAKGLFDLSKKMTGLLRDTEENVIGSSLQKEAPELLEAHRAARQAYSASMDTIESLNDRLHVGKYYGPSSFIKGLEEMSPETVLRRMQGLKDGDLLGMLSEKFPATADKIKEFTLDGILAKAAKSPGAQEFGLNTKTLFREIGKLSPEMKAFAITPDVAQKLSAIQQLVEKFPAKLNPSGTARTLDSLWKHVPGGAASVISLLLGHNPVTGFLIGTAAKHIGRDIPDAIKLSMLKFLGSSAPVEAGAFETMAKAMHGIQTGAQRTNRAIEGVFKAGSEVLPEHALPSEKGQEKLEKTMKAAQLDPSILSNATGNLAYYMPDHATSMGTSMGRVLSYLDSIRPNTDKTSILGPNRQPNAFEQAEYQRAINIAQQPLILLDKIKQGTLTLKDMAAAQAMYPNLIRGLQNKLTTKLADVVDRGHSIPYTTQLCLSMFLGMPLEASVKPQNILAYQPTPPAPQSGSKGQPGASEAKSKGLNKIASADASPSQAREQAKAQRS